MNRLYSIWSYQLHCLRAAISKLRRRNQVHIPAVSYTSLPVHRHLGCRASGLVYIIISFWFFLECFIPTCVDVLYTELDWRKPKINCTFIHFSHDTALSWKSPCPFGILIFHLWIGIRIPETHHFTPRMWHISLDWSVPILLQKTWWPRQTEPTYHLIAQFASPVSPWTLE